MIAISKNHEYPESKKEKVQIIAQISDASSIKPIKTITACLLGHNHSNPMIPAMTNPVIAAATDIE